MPNMESKEASSKTRRRKTAMGTSTDSINGSAEPQQPPSDTSAAESASDSSEGSLSRSELMSNIRSSVMRAILMYAILRYARSSAPKPEDGNVTKVVKEADLTAIPMGNAWSEGCKYELRVFASESDHMLFYDALSSEASPVWTERDLSYTLEEPNYRSKNLTLTVPPAVAFNNASWYAHVFVAKKHLWSLSRETIDRSIIDQSVLYFKHDIIKWLPSDARKEGKNLLSSTGKGGKENVLENQGKSGEGGTCIMDSCEVQLAEEVLGASFLQMWKPYLPVVLVTNHLNIQLNQLPEAVATKFRVLKEAQRYTSPMYVNHFWILGDMLEPMNGTVSEVTLEVSFSPLSFQKFSLYRQFEATWQAQVELGTSDEGQSDKMKRIFLDTNPILLGVTIIVSLAHTILEGLAFRNDISHWKSIKSMEGISVRSMMWKIGMEIVILLYLWDNETSWIISIGNGIGIIIEVWKLCKAVDFKNFGKCRLFGVIPWFDIKHKDSYSRKTKEYDEQAMRYLSYVMYPLVVAYSIYSLVYEKHKSWYSWVLRSLVGTVYTFGFIMMFPQIFINYKLKSVAHLPMKAMMYKTLNTVIDDLFSFVIKMPLLHRLACFRDDIVFAIYLYQRWVYPVDKSRVNEFGQSFDEQGNENGTEATGAVSSDKDSVQSEGVAAASSDSKPKTEEDKKNE